jgi:hypothetical protein
VVENCVTDTPGRHATADTGTFVKHDHAVTDTLQVARRQ